MPSRSFCLKVEELPLSSSHLSVGKDSTLSSFQMWKKLTTPPLVRRLSREGSRGTHQGLSPIVMTPWIPNLGDLKSLACPCYSSRILLFFLKMLCELEFKAASSNYLLVGTRVCYRRDIHVDKIQFLFILSVFCYRVSGKSSERCSFPPL